VYIERRGGIAAVRKACNTTGAAFAEPKQSPDKIQRKNSAKPVARVPERIAEQHNGL